MSRRAKTQEDTDNQHIAMEEYVKGYLESNPMNEESETIATDIPINAEDTPKNEPVQRRSTRMVSPQNIAKTAIREMELTSEQKQMIIDTELSKIIKKSADAELQGGLIPCFIEYPYDNDGFATVKTFIKADTRYVKMAWDYYKENSDKPTVKEFVQKLWDIVGTSEQYRRVEFLRLN